VPVVEEQQTADWGLIIGIIVGVIVLAGGGVAAFFLLRKRNAASADAENAEAKKFDLRQFLLGLKKLIKLPVAKAKIDETEEETPSAQTEEETPSEE